MCWGAFLNKVFNSSEKHKITLRFNFIESNSTELESNYKKIESNYILAESKDIKEEIN